MATTSLRRSIAALALALPACVQVSERVPAPTSVRVSLQSPAESMLGVDGKPVNPAELLFDLSVLDDQGAVARGDFQVDGYLASGGSRLSLRDPCTGKGGAMIDGGTAPDWLLTRVGLLSGTAKGQRVNLRDPVLGPLLFGQVSLTFLEPTSGVAGATPPITFPNPTIRQLMEPLDLNARNASFCSRVVGRQAAIRASDGASLVVSSVFSNGFAVSDSLEKDYRSLYVFTFSQPSTSVRVGRVLTRLSGIIAKFNGATQLANPTVTPSMDLKPDLVPKAVDLLAAARPASQPANMPVPDVNKNLIKLIGSPVRVNAFLCDLTDSRRRDQYNSYSTLVLTYDPREAVKDACDSRKTFSVQLPSRGFAGVDPDMQAGKEVTITGMLRNSAASESTLFWTLVVRDAQDVCFGGPAQCSN